MKWLVELALIAVLLSPTVASGQYTFGDWARDQGYSPGDVLPSVVDASGNSPAIDSLNGLGEFEWTTTPTSRLRLNDNQISSIAADDFNELSNLTSLFLASNQISDIEARDFSGLADLSELSLNRNQISSIEADDFNELPSLTSLHLGRNQISSIESGSFSGLSNLTDLRLNDNQIPSLELGDISGLTDLMMLNLSNNPFSNFESGAFSGMPTLTELSLNFVGNLAELNLANADFSSLNVFDYDQGDSQSFTTSVSLRNIVVNQTSLAALLEGGGVGANGIGGLSTITEMDLSGIDFVDITDLEPLYVMDDLTDLWLVDAHNLDATDLDVLLDNLEAIEGTHTEGVLHMTLLDFIDFVVAGNGLLADWYAEPGHHVEFLEMGDVNHDNEVNGLDVDPFVDVLLASQFDVAADMDRNGAVNGLDIEPFVAVVVGGGAHQIPEPSAVLLGLVALAVVGGWRKWGG